MFLESVVYQHYTARWATLQPTAQLHGPAWVFFLSNPSAQDAMAQWLECECFMLCYYA